MVTKKCQDYENADRLHLIHGVKQTCLRDLLLCGRIVDLTVVEDPARDIVAYCSSTDIDEPTGLH